LKQKNILDDLFVKTKNKIGMQEVLSFEIGGQTYKLTGNNKELTARAAHLVNNKFEIIKKQSVAATTRENIYMLSALNLAEELVELEIQKENIEDYVETEVNKMISFVHNKLNHLLNKQVVL